MVQCVGAALCDCATTHPQQGRWHVLNFRGRTFSKLSGTSPWEINLGLRVRVNIRHRVRLKPTCMHSWITRKVYAKLQCQAT